MDARERRNKNNSDNVQFLSYSMVVNYLKLLTDNGSLEYYEPDKAYRITEKGIRFLEIQSKINDTLKF